MTVKKIYWLIALIGIMLSQPLFAQTCGYSGTEGGQPLCSTPGKVVTYQASCPKSSGQWGCYETWVMPIAEISCDSANGVVQCEAWPQTDEFEYQYQFTPISGVNGYSASGPEFVGNCTGRTGRVSVTVIHPNGQTSTASAPFPCLQDQ